MRLSAVALLIVAVVPRACSAQKGGYQDAVLVRFESVRSEANCQTSVAAHSEGDRESISANGTASTSCSDAFYRHYTVNTAENRYVSALESTKTGTALGLATLGWSRDFAKQSVLANLLPGTHVEGFHVRDGKRESRFISVSAI